MDFVMCWECGEFIPSKTTERVEPLSDECPECGGIEFVDNQTGETIQTDTKPASK